MKNLFLKTKLWLQLSGILCLTLVSLSVFGQGNIELKSLHKELTSIIKLIETNNFQEAVNSAKILYRKSNENPDVCLLLGLGYINLGNKPDSAVWFLNKGLELLPKEDLYSETGVNLYLSLAKAYQMVLKPEDAITIYNQLEAAVSNNSIDLIEEIAREKEICYNAKVLLQNPIALEIVNLGSEVNTPFDDHSPLIAVKGGKMYFTSRREQNKLSLQEDGQYPEKICIAETSADQWSNSKLLNTFYRRNEHESAVSISADGKTMFLFKFDMDGKNLYSSQFKNGDWTQPKRLPEPINSYDDETHCSLSADESTLFFTSDREGGYGGLDVYMVKKQENGKWGEARNLGPNINTKYDEETPMIYLDGKTLYFASEGHNSMGMYDIFYSRMDNDSVWSSPINMGFPINTPGDDFFFVPTIDRNKAYYATSKFADNIGGLDIYQVEFESRFKGELAVVEGKVEQDGKTKTIRILVSRAEDMTLVGDYRPDSETGEYTMFLETGGRYQIKEVRQTIEEVILGEIEIPKAMSYKGNNQVVVMKDIKMEPPLSPSERIIRQKTMDDRLFAEVQEKEQQPFEIKNIEIKPLEIIHDTPESYTIQLLALRKQRLTDFSIFNGLDKSKIQEYVCTDGYYRYTYRIFNSKEHSLGSRKAIVQSGIFKDAFVRPLKQVEELTEEISFKASM